MVADITGMDKVKQQRLSLENYVLFLKQYKELQRLVDASSLPAEKKKEHLQEIQQLKFKALYVKKKEEPELER